MKYYSFDIFDTIVCRPFLDPRFLFYSAEKELRAQKIIEIGEKSWMDVRSKAEIHCRRSGSVEEVTLDEIYEQLYKEGFILYNKVEQAKNIETTLELNYCSPIEKTFQRIKELHNSNNPVIYISDTYLSEEVIKGLLAKARVLQENDKI